MQIAIIGAGEVGRAYLRAPGAARIHTVLVCDPSPSQETLEVVERTGATLHRELSGWLASAHRVWLCVTGDLAPVVCRDMLKYIGSETVIVDLTTASAADKRDSFALAAARQVDYVDAVILGAIATTAARTPLLAAGALAATAMHDFEEPGAPVRVLERAHAGDAAVLKLLRTIVTKGLEALAVECLVAAEQLGVRRELYEAMSDIDRTGFANFLDMLATATG